jgi:hypothetical protein
VVLARVPWYHVPWYHGTWNPQTRTTTETVLREAMQAMVRVHAHMLARIVVEMLSSFLYTYRYVPWYVHVYV